MGLDTYIKVITNKDAKQFEAAVNEVYRGSFEVDVLGMGHGILYWAMFKCKHQYGAANAPEPLMSVTTAGIVVEEDPPRSVV